MFSLDRSSDGLKQKFAATPRVEGEEDATAFDAVAEEPSPCEFAAALRVEEEEDATAFDAVAEEPSPCPLPEGEGAARLALFTLGPLRPADGGTPPPSGPGEGPEHS